MLGKSLLKLLIIGMWVGVLFWLPFWLLSNTSATSAPLWQQTNPLPYSVIGHTTFRYGDYVYTIGGRKSDFTYSDDVFKTQINPGGTLNSWARTTNLPEPLAHHSATVYGDTVIVIGGWNGSADINYIYCGAIDSANGNITSWQRVTNPLLPRIDTHAAVVYTPTQSIYVIGGWDQNLGSQGGSTNRVYRLRVNDSSNCLSSVDWSIQDLWLIPDGLIRHRAAIYKNHVYVLAGMSKLGGVNTTVVNRVFVGTINGVGNISWVETTSLPGSVYWHDVLVSEFEQKIYVLGGQNGLSEVQDLVYSSIINEPDGTLQEWEQEPSLSLPSPVSQHRAVLSEQGVPYLVGGWFNGEVEYIPPLAIEKEYTPEEVHEGSEITFRIDYANHSFITRTLTLTDFLPDQMSLLTHTISPAPTQIDPEIVWHLSPTGPRSSGYVQFTVRLPLLPDVEVESEELNSSPGGAAFVTPASISCNSTQFWAVGVTRQPPLPNPHTIEMTIPSGLQASEMWLLMKGTDNISPTVDGNPTQLVITSTNSFGTSIWSTPITPLMIANGQITIQTWNPRELNALFLFEENDPPFDKVALNDFVDDSQTLTYTLTLPSVPTETMDVLLPIMDVTYWTDDLLPDDRLTTVTMHLDDQFFQPVTFNEPNQGNGLVMTQFPFTIGPLSGTVTSTVMLTVTIDTEDSIYTLGPRICRPVYIENTAQLCSHPIGCVSDTVRSVTLPASTPTPYTNDSGIYLPILKTE